MMLDSLEQQIHKHLMRSLEGVGDVLLHCFPGTGPEHCQQGKSDAAER